MTLKPVKVGQRRALTSTGSDTCIFVGTKISMNDSSISNTYLLVKVALTFQVLQFALLLRCIAVLVFTSFLKVVTCQNKWRHYKKQCDLTFGAQCCLLQPTENRLLQNSLMYTNYLVNADSFYVNFTNTTFQKIPITDLTHTIKQKAIH